MPPLVRAAAALGAAGRVAQREAEQSPACNGGSQLTICLLAEYSEVEESKRQKVSSKADEARPEARPGPLNFHLQSIAERGWFGPAGNQRPTRHQIRIRTPPKIGQDGARYTPIYTQ